jgi:hypothetical protein
MLGPAGTSTGISTTFPLERAPHLDVAAQPHHQQQWTALASHRDAQQVAIDPGEREEPPAG